MKNDNEKNEERNKIKGSRKIKLWGKRDLLKESY